MLQKKQILALILNSGMICLMMTMLTGCSMLPHSLQPTQLRKLNRGRELGRDTSNFSIKDPEIIPGPFHAKETNLTFSSPEQSEQEPDSQPGDFPAFTE